ncbi:hypothetical protein CYLTODRAFT_495140 [Cylindrobasidium torrendii FP15055 ss-10]|uniref:DUF6532 domain-containing protein n=1 Tax=Cylindrobasidium torrendii FP15055 ss-10 TaxID=1314674 RepID=A0A0D7ATG9_9AGAR|nr:hypothetical protein CYLTODRAFT_495140 [Cylindrobasidium torrendii FP15055 ss-10]
MVDLPVPGVYSLHSSVQSSLPEGPELTYLYITLGRQLLPWPYTMPRPKTTKKTTARSKPAAAAASKTPTTAATKAPSTTATKTKVLTDAQRRVQEAEESRRLAAKIQEEEEDDDDDDDEQDDDDGEAGTRKAADDSEEEQSEPENWGTAPGIGSLDVAPKVTTFADSEPEGPPPTSPSRGADSPSSDDADAMKEVDVTTATPVSPIRRKKKRVAPDGSPLQGKGKKRARPIVPAPAAEVIDIASSDADVPPLPPPILKGRAKKATVKIQTSDFSQLVNEVVVGYKQSVRASSVLDGAWSTKNKHERPGHYRPIFDKFFASSFPREGLKAVHEELVKDPEMYKKAVKNAFYTNSDVLRENFVNKGRGIIKRYLVPPTPHNDDLCAERVSHYRLTRAFLCGEVNPETLEFNKDTMWEADWLSEMLRNLLFDSKGELDAYLVYRIHENGGMTIPMYAIMSTSVYHCFGEWDRGTHQRKSFSDEYHTHYLKEIKDLTDTSNSVPGWFEELKHATFAEACRQANMQHEIGARDAQKASNIDVDALALRTAKKKAARLGISLEELERQQQQEASSSSAPSTGSV